MLLAFSILTIGTINNQFGMHNASAAGETITSSKPTFFGSNVVEITVTDDRLKDNNDVGEKDELSVSFNVHSGSNSVIESVTVIGNETGDSGRFVFYVTADGDVTTANMSAPEFGSTTAVIFIGEGGDVNIGTDAGNNALGGATDGISLDEGATITITYRDASTTLTYENTKADVSLDRTTVGSDGFVYLDVADQDANNDPTGRDVLNFDGTVGNLTMQFTDASSTNLGQAIATAGLDFKETSDNSGIFEVRVPVATVFGITATQTPKSVKIEMRDFEVYPNDSFYGTTTLGKAGTDNTSESVTVDNSDGIFQDVTNPATPRSELAVKVLDPDRNLDSRVKDRIPKAIAADLSSGGTADDEPIASTPVDLIETGVNTGVFVPDLSNNVFEVTIAPAHAHDGIVQIDSAASAKSDILVRYGDFTPDKSTEATTVITGGNAKIILFKGKAAANTPAVLSLAQSSIGPQDKVFLVVTDPDLNDDKDAIDSFDLTIPATSFSGGSLTVTSVLFNQIDIANLKLESIIGGSDATATYPLNTINVSFQETGEDTGIFAAEFSYKLISTTSQDGDNTKFKWTDDLLDTPLDSSARLTIHEADRSVSWQQNEYGLPYAPDGKIGATDLAGFDIDGLRTRIKLLVTDPTLNKDSSTVEQVKFNIANGGIEGTPDLTVKLVGPNANVLLDSMAAGIQSCGGMGGNITFTETGANTGVFDKTFDFSNIPAGACHNLTPSDFANARLVARYEDSTASTVLKGYNAIVTTSSKIITSGQEIILTVNDPDQNHDRDVKEQVEIQIDSEGLPLVKKNLDETDLNTGIFSKKLKVGEDFSILDNDKIVDDVTIRYIDTVTSTGETNVEKELKLIPPSGNGKLLINPENNIGPATKITITLTDADLNSDPNIQDNINFDALRIRTTNTDIVDDEIRTGQEGLQMEETDNNSGVFKLTMTLVPITPEQKDSGQDIRFVASGDQLDFPAEPTDTIAISYRDESHSASSPDLVNVVIHVMSFDPVISTDKAAYMPGEIMTVTIEDPDANRDPDVIDVIEDVRATTAADAVGTSFEAVETGANTGMFSVQVPIVEEPESDAIAAKVGDTITIKYTDDFPANYNPDHEKDKDFTYAVPVGKTSTDLAASTTPSAPVITDITGKELSELNVGQQIVLATTVTNNQDSETAFATILEVRDSNGITIFLGWSTGTLTASGSGNVGLSWTPAGSGSYTVRTFVLSSLQTPQILSSVKESSISVS